MVNVYVSGSFDDIRARHVRFLQEAARLGRVSVLLWSDDAVKSLSGQYPKFGFEERRYFLESVRYIDSVIAADEVAALPDELPFPEGSAAFPAGSLWAVADSGLREQAYWAPSRAKEEFCARTGLVCRVITPAELEGFPCEVPDFGVVVESGKPRVIVTGSFDWLHTGHLRFFEEAAAFGELTAVVGHDANIRLLKGEGHPLIAEDERRYMVGSLKFVARALISTGNAWLDAEPEIEKLKPAKYIVNADGDKPEKRCYCELHGIEYVVLERKPKDGLPARSSTALRGF